MNLGPCFGQVHDWKRDAAGFIGRSASPMDQGILPIGVDDQHSLPFLVKRGAQMHCYRAFPHSTLLLRDCNDFSCHVLLPNLAFGILH